MGHALSLSHRPRRGVTLVELAIAVSIVVLMASMAWPSYQARLAKVRRQDAVLALTQVQTAQEMFRAHHGLYAASLSQLRGGVGPVSPQGLYDIVLENVSAEGYGVVARARSDGQQARDLDCPWLALRVDQGMPEQSPNRACWNQ